MKKLFVLFLLVALVPFTVGCGLFGDNDDTSPITTATLTLSRLFPAGSFASLSLRPATSIVLNYNHLFMNVTVNGTKIPLSYKKHTIKAAGVEVEFSAPVLQNVIDTIKGTSVPVEIQIKPAGVTVPVVVVPSQTIAVPSTLISNTPVVLDSAPITTVKSDADILTAIKAENPTISDPVIASYSAVATHGTYTVSTKLAEPTPIMLDSNGKYNFGVTFNHDYANAAAPTFTIKVSHVKADGTVITSSTFKSTDTTSPVVVDWTNNSKKEASIVVTPVTTTYDLTTGEIYWIALEATDATATVNGTSVKATLPSFYVRAH
ncbi:MAG: hypothetical protein PHD82_05295 [Candidatus Riflebacteria bacterium]|nr:hypothetical protein [Candidatus Riflebacteria bacterium]